THRDAPAPIERHAHGLQAKICCSCSWLHFLKSWSLLKTRGDSWYEAGDSVSLPDGDTIACCQSSIGHMPEPIHYDDMVEYLVSVSPAKILKLIDAFEAAEREREQLRAELEAAAADKRDAEKIEQAAREVLNWTEAKHRPPKAEVVPTGEMALVRVHALVELHAALAQRQGEGS
ncbi:hypothetical protein, partial [Burkholderia multivorans]|uniref:hypothetical protein n=1 Tax=Burkholderia multivorans TaxID=87883 RepID=UPI001C23E3B7